MHLGVLSKLSLCNTSLNGQISSNQAQDVGSQAVVMY